MTRRGGGVVVMILMMMECAPESARSTLPAAEGRVERVGELFLDLLGGGLGGSLRGRALGLLDGGAHGSAHSGLCVFHHPSVGGKAAAEQEKKRVEFFSPQQRCDRSIDHFDLSEKRRVGVSLFVWIG